MMGLISLPGNESNKREGHVDASKPQRRKKGELRTSKIAVCITLKKADTATKYVILVSFDHLKFPSPAIFEVLVTSNWLTFDHERVGLDLLTGCGDRDHVQGKFPLQLKKAMMLETLPAKTQ